MRPAATESAPLRRRWGELGTAGGRAGDNSARRAIPLGQVAQVREGVGPGQIQHLDNERVVTVGANTENRPLSA